MRAKSVHFKLADIVCTSDLNTVPVFAVGMSRRDGRPVGQWSRHWPCVQHNASLLREYALCTHQTTCSVHVRAHHHIIDVNYMMCRVYSVYMSPNQVDVDTELVSGTIGMLRIRNPWGDSHEWKGAWGDG